MPAITDTSEIAVNSRAWPAPTDETPENPTEDDGIYADFLPIPFFVLLFFGGQRKVTKEIRPALRTDPCAFGFRGAGKNSLNAEEGRGLLFRWGLPH